jgi:hypothetical protein
VHGGGEDDDGGEGGLAARAEVREAVRVEVAAFRTALVRCAATIKLAAVSPMSRWCGM